MQISDSDIVAAGQDIHHGRSESAPLGGAPVSRVGSSSRLQAEESKNPERPRSLNKPRGGSSNSQTKNPRSMFGQGNQASSQHSQLKSGGQSSSNRNNSGLAMQSNNRKSTDADDMQGLGGGLVNGQFNSNDSKLSNR